MVAETKLLSDDIFRKMFTSNGHHHPLIHWAWADWNTKGDTALHEAFLGGNIWRIFDGADKMWAELQRDLVWKYLYPSRDFLAALVAGLFTAYYKICVNVNPNSALRSEGFGGEVKAAISVLFGKDRTDWLESLHRSLSGGFFEWDTPQKNQPPPDSFASIAEMVRFLPEIVKRIAPPGQKERNKSWDPAVAKYLLGSVKDGWNVRAFIPTLLRPLDSLLRWVAEDKTSQFRFGTVENAESNPPYGKALTPLGELHLDFQDINVAGTRLGVALFLVPPPKAMYVRRLQDVNGFVGKEVIQQYAAGLGYLEKADRGSDAQAFRELLALAGYKYAVWTLPAVEKVGEKYALAPGEHPARHFLDTEAYSGRRNYEKLTLEPDTHGVDRGYGETISKTTWEGLVFVMKRKARELKILRLAAQEEEELVSTALAGGGQFPQLTAAQYQDVSTVGSYGKKRKRVTFDPKTPPERMATGEWRLPPGFHKVSPEAAYSLQFEGGVRPFEIEDVPRDTQGGNTTMYMLVGGAAALALLALR